MADDMRGPVDYTVCCFAALLNWLDGGYVWRAKATMEDALARQLVADWLSLQASMGERLQRDYDAGYIDEAQFNFAMELLTNLDQYEWEEAATQFLAWAEWVRSW